MGVTVLKNKSLWQNYKWTTLKCEIDKWDRVGAKSKIKGGGGGFGEWALIL